MAAPNTLQLFSRVADVQWVASGLGANTATDGTGTTVLIFTADATNGGRIERVNVIHLGTNAAGLLRFFVNNGATSTVAANNSLVEELAMPANTVSQIAISVPQVLQRVPIIMPPGFTLRASVATAVAAGYQITAFGGKY